ncbi:hypothetical protein NEF87_004566 [Candidatus Lokiarchaeum ossiferum]|uniref:C_GCAxxG_C_C family protein n=1 Tax=Candidatus Lokiarchaeum ossiferum TaxID=2951803 RepID=A0ABY6HXM1_9ARCH|nr:hypothetical protein NEF87_004566 [Candidatus Lokiarchaeum sp. B-35]
MVQNELKSEIEVLWDNDHNCAQSTAKGILNYYKFEKEGQILSNSFLPYGGGFKEGSICGAISGTLAAMSFILSNSNVENDKIVELTNQMKSEFLEEFPSVNCHTILDPFRKPDGEIDKDNAERRNLCTKAVTNAANLAHQIISNYLNT